MTDSSKKTDSKSTTEGRNVETADRKEMLKRSLLKIRRLQTQLDAAEQSRRAPIAIVGMACRFPAGANSPDAYWDLLRNGIDAVGEVPADRWDVKAYFSPGQSTPGKTYTNMAGFLDDVESFDPLFFGMSPREAESLDPQQRLLLEVAWEALEDAGVPPLSLANTATGVFVGMTGSDYLTMRIRSNTGHDTYTGSGVSRAVAAGRLSYVLGLTGPAVCVDTACSSSLVAIHDACQSLRARECTAAIAGGVQLILSPDGHITACQNNMLSPDGRCKTFDAEADGYVRAEGCGLIVLKTLEDAEASGDNILGVIRGTAINQDGRSAGLTAPNGRAQESVIRAALADAGVDANEVSYVETHGTGTSLGDPIEVQSLGAVQKGNRDRAKPLIIGAVKSTIGHAEAAAGVAGLIKTVLALRNEEIPPNLHMTKLNPHIPWDELPVEVAGTTVTPWPKWTDRKLAGVSSFGFSGTNVHMVIESGRPPIQGLVPPEQPKHLLALSAKCEVALDSLISSYRQLLNDDNCGSLANICYSANTGRSHLSHRISVAGSSKQEVMQLLESHQGIGANSLQRGIALQNRQPGITFLFTGEGSQYVGMGRELFETQPYFRKSIMECEEILREHLEESLLSVLYPGPDSASSAEKLIHRPEYAEPVIFALEWSLATLWQSWGVKPSAVIGHGIGELVAASIAGVFGLQDGLLLAAERGRLTQQISKKGTTANALAPEAKVLDSKLDAFEAAALGVDYSTSSIDLISTVTGRTVGNHEALSASYWRDQARSPVRFTAAMHTLEKLGSDLIVEIGPGSTLLSMGQSCLPDAAKSTWLPSLQEDTNDWSQVLSTLSSLYLQGADIDWNGFYRDYSMERVPLPTYPFQRQRYPVSELNNVAALPAVNTVAQNVLHPLVAHEIRSAVQDSIFETVVDINLIPYLAEHRFYDKPVFPAAAFVEVAVTAARFAGAKKPIIEELALHRALFLSEHERQIMQVVVSPAGRGERGFKICSRIESEADGEWTTYASGKLRDGQCADLPTVDLASIRDRCKEAVSVQLMYDRVKALGVEYGPKFRGIKNAWRGHLEAFAEIQIHPDLDDESPAYLLHPTLLDAAYQVVGAALGDTVGDDIYMPVEIGEHQTLSRPKSRLFAHATVTSNEDMESNSVNADVRLVDIDGMVVSETSNLKFKRVSKSVLNDQQRLNIDDWLYYVAWQASPLELESDECTGHWVIFADDSGLGTELGSWIEDRGGICTTVTKLDRFKRKNDHQVGIRPTERSDMTRLLDEVANGDDRPLRGVIYLWALDSDVRDETSLANLVSDAKAVNSGALNLAGALAGGASADTPRLWLVTRGSRMVGAQVKPNALNQSTLWGLGAVIATEQPELKCVRVDLDPGPDRRFAATSLAREILTSGDENQVAFRDYGRYVARLVHDKVRGKSKATLEHHEMFQLDITERGLLDSLEYVPLAPRPPEPGEIEIEVAATGLNFRDVLNALGTYSGEPGPLGNECAGRVTAVGTAVTHLAIGDQVAALASNTFSSHVMCDARFVVRVPDNLSLAEAATIPLAFLTSDYALRHRAKLASGQKVLIHAAAGGVGMAGVQIAQRAGAEVFATAGSPRKRELLRQLGVAHVMDSRSLDFADEILKITNGEGVDVILNSLNGDFIEKSLSVLAQGGHFLEIGMAGIWTSDEISASRPDARYDIIFLGESLRDEPGLIRKFFNDLMSLMERGKLKPLPRHDFSMSRVVDAFRFMASAKHIGKVVVHRDLDDHGTISPGWSSNVVLDNNATYMVTGGLGGLGFRVARWLATNGAGCVLLVGRNAPTNEVTESIEEIRREGVRVCVETIDIADEVSVKRMMTTVSETMPTLRGIVHCAGVLDDGVLTKQTWQRFETVMSPKVAGAWNLHRATAGVDLEFFVLFSSIATVFGAAGQGNYATANAFLDALAENRRAQKLPALSLNWGAWSEIGMVAKLGELGEKRKNQYGIGTIAPDKGVELFGSLFSRNCAQVGIIPMNWSDYFDAVGSTSPPFFSELAIENSENFESTPSVANTVDEIMASPVGQRAILVETFVRDQISSVLSLDPAQPLDADLCLSEVGMDSLMAVELTNRIRREIAVAVPMAAWLGGISIAEVTSLIMEKLAETVRSVQRPDADDDWEEDEL